ncbi:MAG: hypothetical protein RL701_6204 [Pseudomonadota bacterium]|jgi:hypothetical protein
MFGRPFALSLMPLALCAALLCACGPGERAQLERALIGRGRLALVADESWQELRVSGTELVPVASLPPVAAALARADASELARALKETSTQGLLVDPAFVRGRSGLAQQLAGFARLDGLQGAYLARNGALYMLDPVRAWNPELRAGLAAVARRLVAGDAAPRLSSFPLSVRRLDPVEVMVLLRAGDQPKLWRSARGSSFARALLTAAAIARQRWIERSSALGGKLPVVLPTLTVELSLLQDDGEIGTRSQSFIDLVTSLEHGVGYERKGGWQYLLPEATHKNERKPSQAYRQLFKDNGLPADSLDQSDLRLYRLAVQQIGISEPTRRADDDFDAVGARIDPRTLPGAEPR